MFLDDAIPLGVIGTGKAFLVKQILVDRLNDAPTIAIDFSSADEYRDMAERLSAACGTVIAVGWSALQFEISAVREDGAPLTDRMQEAFQSLLLDKFDRSLLGL
mgnify:CR=1 FL=1